MLKVMIRSFVEFAPYVAIYITIFTGCSYLLLWTIAERM